MKRFLMFIAAALTLTQAYAAQYHIAHSDKILPLFQKINEDYILSNITQLTQFPDRYVNSSQGVHAAEWLENQFNLLAITYHRDDVSVYFISTKGGKQPSVVMKVGNDLPNAAIVIGAHMDTLESGTEYRPGADDDASGVATLLESARVILSSNIKLTKPIYFILYAGEEEDEMGSKSVVAFFKKNKMPVEAVLQLDMVGYVTKNGGIGMTDDFTDSKLSTFVGNLIHQYINIPVGKSHCGYACSDHASWFNAGIPVAYPFETIDDDGSPYRHSKDDTIDTLSMTHIRDFVKLSIAFLVELAT